MGTRLATTALATAILAVMLFPNIAAAAPSGPCGRTAAVTTAQLPALQCIRGVKFGSKASTLTVEFGGEITEIRLDYGPAMAELKDQVMSGHANSLLSILAVPFLLSFALRALGVVFRLVRA